MIVQVTSTEEEPCCRRSSCRRAGAAAGRRPLVVDADEDHAGATVVVDVVGEGADGFADGVGSVAGHASLAFDEFGLVVGEQRFQFGIGVSDLHAPLRGPFTLAEGAEDEGEMDEDGKDGDEIVAAGGNTRKCWADGRAVRSGCATCRAHGSSPRTRAGCASVRRRGISRVKRRGRGWRRPHNHSSSAGTVRRLSGCGDRADPVLPARRRLAGRERGGSAPRSSWASRCNLVVHLPCERPIACGALFRRARHVRAQLDDRAVQRRPRPALARASVGQDLLRTPRLAQRLSGT